MCLSVKWGRCLTYRLSRKTEDGRCAGGHTSRPGLGASSEGSECSATDGVSAEAPHTFSGVAKERPPEYLVLLVIALKFPSALLPFKGSLFARPAGQGTTYFHPCGSEMEVRFAHARSQSVAQAHLLSRVSALPGLALTP